MRTKMEFKAEAIANADAHLNNAGLPTYSQTLDALRELVEVARLRGDDDLPHPADDPKEWSARMQEAWNDAGALVDGWEG